MCRLIGALATGGLLAASLARSAMALAGASSWATSLAGGAGAALGWWMTFTTAGEAPPAVPKANPFTNDDEGPGGAVTPPG